MGHTYLTNYSLLFNHKRKYERRHFSSIVEEEILVLGCVKIVGILKSVRIAILLSHITQNLQNGSYVISAIWLRHIQLYVPIVREVTLPLLVWEFSE